MISVREPRLPTFFSGFAERIGFFAVLGAIDCTCTVIRIARPKVHEEAFFNYKHEHSLNANGK